MTIEEFLNLITNENQDKCVVDKNLRTIRIPSSIAIAGVESDDDVNHIPFEMPRYYGAVDLSGFDVTINYVNANGDGDRYIVEDLVMNESTIYFEWVVGRLACKYAGAIRFIVCLRKMNGDVVDQEFNSTIASLPVLEGLEPDVSEDVEEQKDYILQVLHQLTETTTVVNNYATNASNSATQASTYATNAQTSAFNAAASAASAEESARAASHGGIAFDIVPTENSPNGITSGAVYTAVQQIMDLMHPVGSLYFTLDSTNPATMFGGQWVREAVGKTIFGVDADDTDFDSSGETGGAKTQTIGINGTVGDHTLTVNEMPAHGHGTGDDTYKRHVVATSSITDGTCGSLSGTSRVYPYVSSGNSFATMMSNESVGGGAAHNHPFSANDITVNKLPPYMTCYIWRRVA